MFTTLAGENITLEEFLRSCAAGDYVLYIGTDSRNTSLTKFSTVLVAYSPGRGGRVLKHVHFERKIESLAERLQKEAWYSVQLAMEVAQKIPKSVKIEIHLDVNGSIAHKSGRYMTSVVGLVAAQGFTYRIKPEAWCATCVADKIVKAS